MPNRLGMSTEHGLWPGRTMGHGGKPALVQSRATDDTGYVQPSFRQLRAVRGSRSIYHNNAVQTWLVQESGEVKNVQLS
jgi:sulfane dehydrogenase subunit SoxC